MKETHFAYKITHAASRIIFTGAEIEEDHMANLLLRIKADTSEAIYWVFKQVDNEPKQQMCIVDRLANRIYYHHSGVVDNLDETIHKLTHGI